MGELIGGRDAAQCLAHSWQALNSQSLKERIKHIGSRANQNQPRLLGRTLGLQAGQLWKEGGKASRGLASPPGFSLPAQAPTLGRRWPWRQQRPEGGGRESRGSSISRRRGEPGKSGRLSQAPPPNVCLVLWTSGSLVGRRRGCLGTADSQGNPRDTLTEEGGQCPPSPCTPRHLSVWPVTLYNFHPILQGRSLFCLTYVEFQYTRV